MHGDSQCLRFSSPADLDEVHCLGAEWFIGSARAIGAGFCIRSQCPAVTVSVPVSVGDPGRQQQNKVLCVLKEWLKLELPVIYIYTAASSEMGSRKGK